MEISVKVGRFSATVVGYHQFQQHKKMGIVCIIVRISGLPEECYAERCASKALNLGLQGGQGINMVDARALPTRPLELYDAGVDVNI